jgi:hypothetical protein
MSDGARVDCKLAVPNPLDSAPIRSPQEVHTLIASKVHAKQLVEIGTRNGDGISCFSKVTKSASAIEYDSEYCRKLEDKSAKEGLDFSVQCVDYNKAVLDADYITWWQQSKLKNRRVLRLLRRQQCMGKVRMNAEAILIFDRKWPTDVKDYHFLENIISWSQTVQHDERGSCELHSKDVDVRKETGFNCDRAFGSFIVAGVPVSGVSKALSGCDEICACGYGFGISTAWPAQTRLLIILISLLFLILLALFVLLRVVRRLKKRGARKS